MSVGRIICIYFKNHKRRAVGIVLSIGMVTFLSLMPAHILTLLVDDAISSNKAEKLIQIAIVYLSTYFVIGITTFIKDVVLLKTSLDITTDLKRNMMKHVEKMSYKALVQSDSGTLEAYFNNDVIAINELFTSGVVNMATDLFKMIGIVISIFIFSPIFGLIVLGVLPFLVLFTSFIRKRMLKAQLKTKSLEGNVNKILLENVENIEQVKVNKVETYATDQYDQVLNNHFKVSQSSNLYDALFSPVMQIVRNAVVCCVLLISGYQASFFAMSVGEIIAAISLLTDLFTPIENLGMEIQTIQKSVAAIKRIQLFFKTETDFPKIEVPLESFDIRFENVSFAYDEKSVLKNFNLDIKQGDKIALQGPSGSGKSTIMKLAIGLISPSSGRVEIGGVPNASLSDSARRDLFAIVYQDPFFSGGTIYEEISLKDPAITKKMVTEALKQVGLEYIFDLDSVLNEKEYSSGELVLLNIARVIVRNPKIIFLDEMNAKIDPLTGKNMIDLINQIAKDKTVISINHYGSVLDHATTISLNPISD